MSLSPEFMELQSALAGEYSLERELGRGGMGIVYLARDVQLDRLVAIKVLPARFAATAEARDRFLREARTAAGLSHPNIVPIHRVGEAGGHVYFVMSYVAGETLGERVRRAGPLTAADAMRVMREVSWALAYAHGRGVVHRDVKPDNILLEAGSGRALVTDFGIAHVGDSTLDADPGRVIGTAQFMSPEQALNQSVDGRSDLYALGAVGYVAVSGQLPFEAATVPALLLKQVSESARPIAALAPGIPAALAGAIERCLEKDPDNRFTDGEALAAALASDEGRGALDPTLRAWLSERDPATMIYAAWTGLLGIPFLSDLNQYLLFHHGIVLVDMAKLTLIAAIPVVPILGFQVRRARRLFRAGYSLADLRGTLDVGERERRSEVLSSSPFAERDRRALRLCGYAAVSVAVASTFFPTAISLPLELRHVVIGYKVWQAISLGSWIATLGVLVTATLTQTRVIPRRLAAFFPRGIRDALWRSRLGEMLASRLGAPSASRPGVAGVFQPTETALGLAAADLFSALPQPYREQLADLPSIVRSLEARATEARASVAVNDQGDARAQLADAVSALERIRIDLLRLHAGAVDLSPLTTLLEEARALGDDVARLVAAQREVVLPPAERRLPTPA